MKIEINTQKELVAVLDKNDIELDEQTKIIDLLNELELFANIDSANITDRYIKKNNNIFEQLIEIGVDDLYYNMGMNSGKDKLHLFIKNSLVKDSIIFW